MSANDGGVAWGKVAGWAVGGFALEWLAIFFYVIAGLNASQDDFLGGTAGLVAAFLYLPVLFAVLLFFRRTRLAGASVLIGFLFGSIAGAGVCAGFITNAG